MTTSSTEGIHSDKPTPIADETEQYPRGIRILGVGGGIGSGKSTACRLLAEELGCIAHIDADTVAHTVYEPNSQCVQEIASLFGPQVVVPKTGEIDRKMLGSIVFGERDEMKKLEAIVWPHTKRAVLNQIDAIKTACARQKAVGKHAIIVVEAAMLLDAGWNDFCDGIWIVTTTPEKALERLVQRRNLTPEEGQKRIDAQLSRRGVGNLADEVKSGYVSAVIGNSGSLEELKDALQVKLADPYAWYRR